jgi:hypothetical protein
MTVMATQARRTWRAVAAWVANVCALSFSPPYQGCGGLPWGHAPAVGIPAMKSGSDIT